MHLPVKYDPVDWPQVIADLVRGGFTIPSIAARIGVPPSTIKGWRNNGVEPHHESGERLVLLWCNAMQQDRNTIPSKHRRIKPTTSRRTSWIQLSLTEGNEIHDRDNTCKLC